MSTHAFKNQKAKTLSDIAEEERLKEKAERSRIKFQDQNISRPPSAYQKTNTKNLKTFSNYRIFLCMLAAIANNQQSLLIKLYFEHPKVFLSNNSKSKISNRTILHFACCIKQTLITTQIKRSIGGKINIYDQNDENCLLAILYKFENIDVILGKKDYMGFTPAKLAKNVGRNANGQVLLRYAWELRTGSGHFSEVC